MHEGIGMEREGNGNKEGMHKSREDTRTIGEIRGTGGENM